MSSRNDILENHFIEALSQEDRSTGAGMSTPQIIKYVKDHLLKSADLIKTIPRKSAEKILKNAVNKGLLVDKKKIFTLKKTNKHYNLRSQTSGKGNVDCERRERPRGKRTGRRADSPWPGRGRSDNDLNKAVRQLVKGRAGKRVAGKQNSVKNSKNSRKGKDNAKNGKGQIQRKAKAEKNSRNQTKKLDDCKVICLHCGGLATLGEVERRKKLLEKIRKA